MKNYYKILEVEENATEDEIKKSYRSLSKQFHPDLNPEGGEKFKEINEAYEILGDKVKRKNYDSQRNNPYQNTSFENIFESMFGRGGFQQQRPKSSPDKILKLQINPIESYLGLEKNIQYVRDLPCNSCKGSGGARSICVSCNGQGFHVKTLGTGFMVQQIRTVCSSCNGQGQVITERCYLCNGRGTNSVVHEIKIKIPVGSDSGQFLKLQNLGDFRNGQMGDLVIQLEMTSKDNFEKMGNDLIYNMFLDYDGLKSEKYLIPHPDGDLNVDAPKIFDTSRPLRLRGKGYQGGDMYVKLNVKFQRPV